MMAQTPVPGCAHHPGMGFAFVCKTCDDELICMDCVVDRHKKHDLGKLTEYVSEQKRTIQKFVEKLSKTDIPELESGIKENEKNVKESSKQFRAMIDDIKRQGEQMKKEIDQLTDRLVKLCRDLDQMNSDITEKNKSVLTKHLTEELKPRLDRCQQAVTSGTNDDVITVAGEIRSTGPTAPPTVTSLKSAVFKPGIISNVLIDRMLGTIQIDRDTSSHPISPCTVISSFLPSFAYGVCRTCSGDEAWLSYWDKEQIYRVDQKGNTKEKIDCKIKVGSITVSPTTGRVWFCVQDDNSIREITSDNNIVVHFKVGSSPRSLCITQEDMVVVGMSEGIVLYTTDGRMVTDGAGHVCRQEAILPHHMAYCTQTGDMAAADNDDVTLDDYMSGKKTGKQPLVIVMDKYLKLKFRCRYIDTLEPQIGGNQEAKFHPLDVCFDSSGDVLVAEGITKSVLLIDGNNGHFLRTIFISDIVPWCIGLQDDRTLWIGHRANTMKIVKYR